MMFCYSNLACSDQPNLLYLCSQVGDSLPAVQVQEGEPGNKVAMDQLFKGKKGILFAVPGAFTPGCSQASTNRICHHALAVIILANRLFSAFAFRLTSQVLCSRQQIWGVKAYRRWPVCLWMMLLSWLPGERSMEQMARSASEETLFSALSPISLPFIFHCDQ